MAIKEPPERRLSITHFEERRGTIRVSVEHGYAHIHVSQLPAANQAADRLAILSRVAEAFVHVRFPKFTPSGLSFLVLESEAERIAEAIEPTGHHFSVRPSRSVVSVHAANVREEEGLIARIVATLLESGHRVEHIADTHDRLMAVVGSEDVDSILERLRPQGEAPPCPQPVKPSRRGGKVKVMKFGGTSVATAEARAQAAAKVAAAVNAGYRPVVVVSAIGRAGLPYATDTLIDQVRSVSPETYPDLRDLDLMMACGEILSAVIFAQTLSSLGLPAHAFRGDQAGILTDDSFGRARIVAVRPGRLERSLREGYIPVVCGFQGCVAPQEKRSAGEVTTLGRGGSDTTASALGAALNAESVEIYTDVEGVMNADPRIVPEAHPIWSAPYDEIATLAHLGAKVLHPRAAEIAIHYSVPLWVKSTFGEERGTEIVPADRCSGPRRTGVAQLENLVYVRIDLQFCPPDERAATEEMLYRLLSLDHIAVLMVDLSPTSTGLAIEKRAEPALDRVLSTLELSVSLRQDCSMVSLVGHEIATLPSTLRNCLSSLGQAGIHPVQTNAVAPSLSFLVPAAETKAAVRALFCLQEMMNDE